MGNVDIDTIIAAAEEAVAGRPNMVSDGNVQEELARALERHADRLHAAAESIQDVGTANHLGPTSEGEAATFNIRLGVVDHERSLYNTYLREAADARAQAAAIREIGRQLLRTEGLNEEAISRVIRK